MFTLKLLEYNCVFFIVGVKDSHVMSLYYYKPRCNNITISMFFKGQSPLSPSEYNISNFLLQSSRWSKISVFDKG